jgi:hypothetical protein
MDHSGAELINLNTENSNNAIKSNFIFETRE